MKPIQQLLCLGFAALISLPVSATATDTAAEPPSGWQPLTVRYSWSGSGVKKEFRGVPMPAESIYSGNGATKGNVAFTCYLGRFSASIALDPVDMGSVIRNPGKSTRRKIKRQDIKINGESIASTDWIYMPKLKVYQARKRSTAAKLYNSVIRKSEVSMKAKDKSYLPLNLPPLDRAFNNFGAECGMGIAAKKT